MFKIKQTKNHKLLDRLDRICFPADAPHDFTKDICWIATDVDGNPAGYASATIIDGGAFLPRQGVLPAARGKRLQVKLIKASARHCLKILGDGAFIHTYTLYDNLSSANNQIRAGFKLFQPEWTWGGDTGLYWQWKK